MTSARASSARRSIAGCTAYGPPRAWTSRLAGSRSCLRRGFAARCAITSYGPVPQSARVGPAAVAGRGARVRGDSRAAPVGRRRAGPLLRARPGMMRALAAGGIVMALAGRPHATPATKHPAARPATAPAAPPVYVRPAPPLPMPPRVWGARPGRSGRALDCVVVVEDVVFPKGDWESGRAGFDVAFGSPGTPIAIDARLLVPSSGGLDARPEEAGISSASSTRADTAAQPMLGGPDGGRVRS